ncbi:MAG: enoyl-CoA hydratase/isomerase family protein [Acidimicrobiales bacterium]
MSDHRVDIEDGDGVRLIAFARPEVRNAFDLAMYRAVTDGLVGAAADDSIAAVVLTGRGSAFTAGQDLREMVAIASGTADPEAGDGFPGLLDVVQSFGKPLLAAVHGAGVGLGFTILGHVDLVLLDETARLRAPFAEMGVPPEAASSLLLPTRMGWQRAASVLLASEWIDAAEAVESGMALRVVPEGTVLEETMALARRIASFPPRATQEIKRLMTAAHRDAIAAARAREESAFAALFADPATNPGAGLASGLGD